MHEKERKLFAAALKKLLDAEDITQRHLSELTGIPAHRINKFLRAETFPNCNDYNKLAEHYGFTFNEFWNYIGL